MATETQTLLTYDQYVDLPEREDVRFELDEGVLVEMPMASHAHGRIQGNAFALLSAYDKQTGANFVISLNAAFRLSTDTVRGPDVCLARRASYEAKERARGGARRGAPDLAVEVVSESDTAIGMSRKVEQYLRAGAAAVWVLYPDPPQVFVYRRSGDVQRFTSGQSFQEPELLPGLVVVVDELFAGLPL
jgi:Uma2 family endonuclease